MALQKVIPAGSPYSPTNSDIGTVSNYNASNGTFDISNITTTNIRNVLGESTNNVRLLCQSPKINQWALFRPIGTSPYKIGDFGDITIRQVQQHILPPSRPPVDIKYIIVA